MKFKARLYEVNKGYKNQKAYFATIKKDEAIRLKIKERDAILLEINNSLFPTVIRRLKSGGNKFMLGFTVPYNITNKLPTRVALEFSFLAKNLDTKKESHASNYLNLLRIIPNKSIINFPIFLFDLGEKFMVWIYSKGNKPYLLPKEIYLEKKKYNLMEFAGAFFCEGFKARKPNRHRDRFSFSNADPEQIKWFIEASENLLDVSKQEWDVQILFPEKNKELIDFWSRLGLSKNKIKLIKNETVLAEQGVCILNIYNSSLAETIYHLMKFLENESLKSKEYALNFFRGLSRGDLGVSHKDRSIKFSTESEENAVFFRKLCDILEIPTNKIYHNKKGIKGYWGSNISISTRTISNLIKVNAIVHAKRKDSLYKMFLNQKV